MANNFLKSYCFEVSKDYTKKGKGLNEKVIGIKDMYKGYITKKPHISVRI